MEDLLPFYAQVVHKNCPCTKEEFDNRCHTKLSVFFFNVKSYDSLPERNQKTIRNHVTEVMGKLLGLYYTDNEGYICESPSCKHLNENQDFPTFFKNICFNLQFPNGAANTNYIRQYMDDKLFCKPLCFVVALLNFAKQNGNVLLTKQEVGYYVLNNLDVLQGKVEIETIFERIINDRKAKVQRPSLSGSHDWQHIKEMFNLLDLSNICLSDQKYIWLNSGEQKAATIFASNTKPEFDIYQYDPSTTEGANALKVAWQEYYCQMNMDIAQIQTDFAVAKEAIEVTKPIREKGAVGISTVELGDQGETLVYNMELQRVKAYKERWSNKVLLLGKTKGLGYDISSLEADENPIHPEFARYIEVKSTKRITKPSFDKNWSDTINLTAKEWVAAEQYDEYYNIYRVYFTRDDVIVIRIQNPYRQSKDGKIDVFPTLYQMDFDRNAITKQYNTENNTI